MMHAELWPQVTQLDGQLTAQRALCQYCPGAGDQACYLLTMLNQRYKVDLAAHEIYLCDDATSQNQAGFLEQLCILAYLINAKGKDPTDKLLPARALPGGDFFFRGIHALPTDDLAETFGRDAPKLQEIIGIFNGTKCDYGDAAVRLPALPRIWLTIIIWQADEEFPARASLLFDESVTDQMPLDALGALANLTVAALKKAAATA